jgi:Family of unknown function (DUF5335)
MANDTTTRTREIQREEWPDFFDGFSRRHEGWLVTIELLDKDLGDQIEVENKALKGIVAERKRDPKVIDIFVWNKPDEDTTHIIDKPTRVWIEETAEGAEAALEIESEDHGKTLLTFKSPALPETVDGVGPER